MIEFKIGDECWFILYQSNRILCRSIDDIDLNSGEKYLIGDDWFFEKELYSSRLELIQSQIDYWKNMLSEELEQHISDY
jgi:hypothetical protein